jgi:PIN domain nuclease of toxin-antitoxin system
VRLLLDTHALLWWLTDDAKLPQHAADTIRHPGNVVFVSAASAWEVTTKHRIGKLPTATRLAHDFAGQLQMERFEPLAISIEHAQRAGFLAGPHKDPFDRMLIAQAQAENLVLVSNEKVFDSYGVLRLWS